jgi:hypothetical protein
MASFCCAGSRHTRSVWCGEFTASTVAQKLELTQNQPINSRPLHGRAGRAYTSTGDENSSLEKDVAAILYRPSRPRRRDRSGSSLDRLVSIIALHVASAHALWRRGCHTAPYRADDAASGASSLVIRPVNSTPSVSSVRQITRHFRISSRAI